MKHILEYDEWLNEGDVCGDILNDKIFLYKFAKHDIFTESESEYIHNILDINDSNVLNELEYDLLFNYSDVLFEGFFNNIMNKSKNMISDIGNSVSNVFNYVHKFIKKYLEDIIYSFDKTFNIFGDRNSKSNQSIATSIYGRYKENINSMVDSVDDTEILWYNECYNFLLKAYNTTLNSIKSLFISETKDMIKESILNNDFIFENDSKQVDDNINDRLKKIKEITIKIDNYINTKFLWLFKILNSTTNFTVQGFAKTISISGGPTPPKSGFKTTSATFLYVMQNKYLELNRRVSKYTNSKVFVSSLVKSTFKKVVQYTIPGTFIMFKLIGLINNIDVTRRLLNTIEKNKTL